MCDPASGVCIWFTGRSGAGKSTVMRALLPLLEEAGRTVTVLDTVPELAKRWCERSSEGKLMRKAFVAGEIVRHGGIAVCVTVSARAAVREAARSRIGSERFLEVFVDVPPEVALSRKSARPNKPPPMKRVKRLARRVTGYLKGAEHPGFEKPEAADLRIDTSLETPEAAAAIIFDELVARDVVSAERRLGARGVTGQAVGG